MKLRLWTVAGVLLVFIVIVLCALLGIGAWLANSLGVKF